MEKLILILMVISAGLLAKAENFFTEGTIWQLETEEDYPPFNEHSVNYVLEGTIEVDGVEGLKMFYYDNNSPEQKILSCIIRTEKEKVYFKIEQSEEWLLLYDFSLQPGEGGYFYMPNSPYYETATPICQYLNCVERIEATSDDGFATLVMEEYDDEDATECFGKGNWYAGIGSERGPLDNLYFDADGAYSRLTEVIYNGNEIFYPGASTSVATNVERGLITVKGSIVTIENMEGGQPIFVFSTNGNIIGCKDSGVNPVSISLPQSGVYIIKMGSTTRKILIP